MNRKGQDSSIVFMGQLGKVIAEIKGRNRAVGIRKELRIRKRQSRHVRFRWGEWKSIYIAWSVSVIMMKP